MHTEQHYVAANCQTKPTTSTCTLLLSIPVTIWYYSARKPTLILPSHEK